MRNILVILVVLLFSASCQQEVSEIWQPEPDEVIQKGGSLTGLIQSVTTGDGSSDNIIDMSSCVSIKLPFSVIVNGEQLEIESESDLDEVEKIFDRYDDDDDILEILFPITVVFPDYSEYEVENEDELEDIIDDCENSLDDIDIECIDIKYPISVSVYDTDNQIAQVIEFNSDTEFYRFIDEIEDEDIVSINFPITVILSDGTELVIADNEELEDIIEASEDTCDEDDDNDFDDDDVDDDEIVQILIDGTWEITDFFNGQDQTEQYSVFRFGFFEDELAIATANDDQFPGEWEVYGDAGYLELELEFENNELLEAIDKDWVVMEYNTDEIVLSYDDSGVEMTMTLTRTGDSTPISAVEELRIILLDENWKIAELNISEEDITSNYEGYSFEFEEDGSMLAHIEDTGDEFYGIWTVQSVDDSLMLTMDFEAEVLADISKGWTITESQSDKVIMESENTPDANSKLILEKN